MESQQLRQIILNELPVLMQNDLSIRKAVLEISRTQFADRSETDTRFEQMMARLERLMDEDSKRWEKIALRLERKIEEDSKKWEDTQKRLEEMERALSRKNDEDSKKWEDTQKRLEEMERALSRKNDEDSKKWEDTQKRLEEIELRLERKSEEDRKKWEATQKMLEDNQQKWEDTQKRLEKIELRLERKSEEDRKKWEESQKRLEKIELRLELKSEEDRKKWEENQQKWEESQKRWEENQRKWGDNKRQNAATIGAIGARWGIRSEASFRNALAGILREFPDVEVTHVTEKDENGVVFGRPDLVELDLIIKNGVLMICEIKSSMSKPDMYIFEKKVRFYEQKHGRQANRRIVISPMVDSHAMPVADNLGIEIYSYADDVNL